MRRTTMSISLPTFGQTEVDPINATRSARNAAALRSFDQSPRNRSILMELSRRYRKEISVLTPQINTPNDLYQLYESQVRSLADNSFIIILVNTKHRVIDTHPYPDTLATRAVMRRAVSRSAAAFFVCRHHMGQTNVTAADTLLVKELTDAACIIGIGLLDYLVIGTYEFISLRERGLV